MCRCILRPFMGTRCAPTASPRYYFHSSHGMGWAGPARWRLAATRHASVIAAAAPAAYGVVNAARHALTLPTPPFWLQTCPATCLMRNQRGQTPVCVAVACERGEVLNAMLLACAGDGTAGVAVQVRRRAAGACCACSWCVEAVALRVEMQVAARCRMHACPLAGARSATHFKRGP